MSISIARRIAQQIFNEVSRWTTVWIIPTTQSSRHKKAVLVDMRATLGQISMFSWTIIAKLMNGPVYSSPITITAIFYKRSIAVEGSTSGNNKDVRHQELQLQQQMHPPPPLPLQIQKKSFLNSFLVACGIVGTHQKGSGRVAQDLPPKPSPISSNEPNLLSHLQPPILEEEPLPITLSRKTISALTFQQDGSLVAGGDLLENRQLLVALIANTEEYLESCSIPSPSSFSPSSSSIRYVCVPSKDILKGIYDDCPSSPAEEDDSLPAAAAASPDRMKGGEKVSEEQEDILLLVDVEADTSCHQDYSSSNSYSPDGSVASNIRSAEFLSSTDRDTTAAARRTEHEPKSLLLSPQGEEDETAKKQKSSQFATSSFIPDRSANIHRKFAIVTCGTDTVMLLSVSTTYGQVAATVKEKKVADDIPTSDSELFRELHSQILWAHSLLLSGPKDCILKIP
eukprot:gene27712-36525_t